MTEKKFNALQTGAHARSILLPGESAADFEKFRRAIFDDRRPLGPIECSITEDIVENRWRRKRMRQATAIETHRHPYGRALEQSGAASWHAAANFIHGQAVARKKSFESVVTPMMKVAQFADRLLKSELSEDFEQRLQQILDVCTRSLDAVERIRVGQDDERDFFDAYSPSNLERLVKLQNALDAQYDKLSARLLREQELRTFRGNLPKIEPDPEPPADHSPKAPSDTTMDLDDDDLLDERTKGASGPGELLRGEDKTELGDDPDDDWALEERSPD